MNNICKEYSATSIQQLTKLITDKQSGELKEKNVYPIGLVQSIFDGITGNRLDVILSLFNCIYIPYGDSKRSTRLKVPNQMRRLGLIITFKDATNTIYTQQYVGNSFDDANWGNDKNWEDCFVSFDSSEAVEQLKQYFTNYINNVIGDITGIKFVIVTNLPSVGEKGTIYLMKNNNSTEANNVYDEYIWLADKNSYEKLGSFSTSIDLSNYQPKLVSGQNIKTINGQSILGSGNIEIVVGNNFPSDGVEGQYLKKSDTGVKWDDGDIFYLTPMSFPNQIIPQNTYNELVNAITNNKIIYIAFSFDGDNIFLPVIIGNYVEDTGDIFLNYFMDTSIYNLHINPDLTAINEEAINLNPNAFVKYTRFVLNSFKISGDKVEYSPNVLSHDKAAHFYNAFDGSYRLLLMLRDFPEDWVELFPIHFTSNSSFNPGGVYSFIGNFEYDDKCYTILLSLVGLSEANDCDYRLEIKVIPHFYIENSTFRNNQFIKRKEDNTYEWSTIEHPRIVLSEFSAKKFFEEYSMVAGADSIGWAGALLIDDFSSDKYRDFYCCMTYGQGIVIRHTYATDTYEYLNSFLADFSTTSSSYTQTNKMNSGGWGKVYDGSALPLAYISRCSPDTNYIHTYYAYQIDTSVTPYNFVKKLTIKYGGSKLANITSDITVDAEKKHLYIHGYKTGSIDAIRGTSIVMVFNLPEPGSSNTITLTDNDIVREFEFFVDEAAQDLHVSGGRLYYPYGGPNHHGLAVIDTSNGTILQDIDLTNISTNFINNPEPEGVYVSNGKLYLNYHHSNSNKNEVCLVEFPLQEVKESIPVATTKTNGLLSFKDKAKLDDLRNSIQVLTQEEYNALTTKSEDTIYFIKG